MKIPVTEPARLSNSAIELYADRIAKAHALDATQPRDIVEFARKLGGQIEYAEDAESLHVNEKNSFVIRVPYFTSTTRDRFTIAHELGHYFLHYRLPAIEGPRGFGRGGKDRAETEANVFASCLLMPREAFIREWNKSGSEPWRVARYFDVSPAAATVRARVIGLSDGVSE